MRTIVSLLSPLLFALSLPALAFSPVEDEVDIREAPAEFYEDIREDLDHLTGDESSAELSTLAMELGLNQNELFRKLQLTTRLNMEPGVSITTDHPANEQMLKLLNTFADNRYQQAVVLMMKGRVEGRNKIQYQAAIDFYNQALDIIRHEPGMKSLALRYTIHDHLGSLNQLIRQYPASLNHLNALQEVSMQLGNNYLRAYAEATLGIYYNKQKNQARALEHFTQALRLANREPRTLQLAMMNFNLAKVHRDMEHWDDALEHAHSAALGFKETDNSPYLSHTMTVIAMVYAEQANWHKAIDYYLNAHQIDVREGNRINQSLNMHNLGEAYSKLNDFANSLTYLKGANQFFREKQLNHYLVYNEALLAEVNLAAGNWEPALHHATESLNFAREKKLLGEQIEAMAFQVQAYQALGQLDKALSTQSDIIAMKEVPGKPAAPVQEDSLLSQQQLKLALSNKEIKLDQLADKNRQQSRIVIAGSVVMLILLVGLIYMYQSRRQLQRDTHQLNKALTQEPNTGHPGIIALLEHLSQRQGPATFMLLNVSDTDFPELAHGQYQANLEYMCQLSCLDNAEGIRSFALHPGIIALVVEGQHKDDELMARLCELLEHPGLTSGILPLPLLQSEEIVIEPEILLEVAQMALYAARSLPQEGCRYVGLYPLDFAPSVIFAHPLYLRLDKSIQRGLIRVSCNGDKTQIQWPEQHQQLQDDGNEPEDESNPRL